MCFKIDGGWLLSALMYTGVSFGLRYGLYDPSDRSRVTSKKSATWPVEAMTLEEFVEIFYDSLSF